MQLQLQTYKTHPYWLGEKCRYFLSPTHTAFDSLEGLLIKWHRRPRFKSAKFLNGTKVRLRRRRFFSRLLVLHQNEKIRVWYFRAGFSIAILNGLAKGVNKLLIIAERKKNLWHQANQTHTTIFSKWNAITVVRCADQCCVHRKN